MGIVFWTEYTAALPKLSEFSEYEKENDSWVGHIYIFHFFPKMSLPYMLLLLSLLLGFMILY